MDDEANIWLVYPHAERNGGYDNLDSALLPVSLHAGLLLRLNRCVVMVSANAALLQLFGDILGRFPGKRVHNARPPRVFRVDKIGDGIHGALLLLHNLVIQVGPVEALGEFVASVDAKIVLYVHDNVLRRGRCQSHHRDTGELPPERAKLLVIGPEVVAPLTDAVCLIND